MLMPLVGLVDERSPGDVLENGLKTYTWSGSAYYILHGQSEAL